MTKPEPRGAAISARARTPSIDLAPLAELLAKSFSADSNAERIRALPLLEFDGHANRLHVRMGGLMRRLLTRKEFSETFSDGAQAGFIRDLDLPARGTTAKLGGRLVPGSEAKTTAAIDKLHEAIRTALDTALPLDALPKLAGSSSKAYLEGLASRLQVSLPKESASASLVPVEFVTPERPATQRAKDVARVLTATETVEAGDWLEKMLAGVRRQLESDDVPQDEVTTIVDTLRLKRDQPSSDVRRFLDFLDEEALSRLRLQVTFKLMEAVAAQSDSALLKTYIAGVTACHQRFSGTAGEPLVLDPSRVYGARNKIDLAEHLQRVMSFYSLPVWAEWSVQIFEVRNETSAGFATKREVSYRFRVNGQNPETGKSAFLSRLDRLEERLLDEPGPNINIRRSLAELVFLHLAIPREGTPGASDVMKEAQAVALRLSTNPVETLKSLLAGLRERESEMDSIADELIRVLTTHSKKIISNANRNADKFYVTVQRGVVDWTALVSMTSTKTNVLVRNERGDDKVAWFSNLIVSENPKPLGGLASYWVETRLGERGIAPTGNASELKMARDLQGRVLPIRFVPFVAAKSDDAWSPEDATNQLFDIGGGIDVEYDIRALSLTRDAQGEEKARYEQLRTAACAAFALIAYLVLYEVIRRLQVHEVPLAAAYLLRLQPRARDARASDGNQALYAISHAVERALSRELPVKMQGFHTQGNVETETWRKRGTLIALQGGAPLETRLRAASPVDKVAVVTYVTRPCDFHPDHGDAEGFLFVSRTYRADRHEEGFRLYTDAMQSRLVDTRKSFREPQLVLEEIARLEKDGYQHIILLSHHFGNRHIGRAAERHAPHSTLEFLEEASNKFPQVFLYPLRRDVFPATRLHKRSSNQSAFEVLSFKDHAAMFDAAKRDMLRSLMPVYTFATLAVVTEDGRPQSGFCTYFLDVENRLSDWAETARQNILGVGNAQPIREALIGVLRGLHYMESEKSAAKLQMLPVLDPFGWASPTSTGAAGELSIMERRNKGSVQLSFPALLAHVTKVLHKESD